MDDSPIARLLGAINELDPEAASALFARDGRLLTADGRSAEGIDAVRTLLAGFLGDLRSASYRITGQWQDGDVWIAEIEGEYELRDQSQTGALARALLLHHGPEGIAHARVYGAHERQLADDATGEEGMWVGGRWVPPL
jgi:SnoaL-like protein